MILSRNRNQHEDAKFLRELCAVFATDVWTLFHPQYLQLASEEEYKLREMPLKSGKSAFRLASSELSSLLAKDAVGFDWTDLSVSDPADKFGSAESVCHVQCVDGVKWYVKTESPLALHVLVNCGFVEAGVDTLPFEPQRLAVSGS